MAIAICSKSDWARGRPLQAAVSPDTSLSPSKGSPSPDLFCTKIGAASTRSKVVNRSPQEEHERRRRIASPSSAERESTTRVSGSEQVGHRIYTKLADNIHVAAHEPALAAHSALGTSSDGTMSRCPTSSSVDPPLASTRALTTGRRSPPAAISPAIDQ